MGPGARPLPWVWVSASKEKLRLLRETPSGGSKWGQILRRLENGEFSTIIGQGCSLASGLPEGEAEALGGGGVSSRDARGGVSAFRLRPHFELQCSGKITSKWSPLLKISSTTNSLNSLNGEFSTHPQTRIIFLECFWEWEESPDSREEEAWASLLSGSHRHLLSREGQLTSVCSVEHLQNGDNLSLRIINSELERQ